MNTRRFYHTYFPKGKAWQEFLKDSVNKRQLFEYLSGELNEAARDETYHFYSTNGDSVLTNRECDMSPLEPCTQEEADTRIMLHLKHAADQGLWIAFVRTVDTDVVMLATHLIPKLGLDEL